MNIEPFDTQPFIDDKARLDACFNNGWSVVYNARACGWIIQTMSQTVGNIGVGRTPREAIDRAMTPNMNTSHIQSLKEE